MGRRWGREAHLGIVLFALQRLQRFAVVRNGGLNNEAGIELCSRHSSLYQ